MKRRAGQAAGALARALAGIGMIVMTLAGIALLTAGGLAFRLSLGPMQIPGVATRLANAISGKALRVEFASAELAWAGYRAGGAAPLHLQLGGIVIRNPAGAVLATLPRLRLDFSPAALLGSRTTIGASGENARFFGSQAPAALAAAIHLSAGFAFRGAELAVTLGAGRLGPPGLDEELKNGRLQFSLSPGEIRLAGGVLDLQPAGGSAPVLRLDAAARKDTLWRGAITLRAAAVQAADLGHYWPADLVPLTRGWVTRNIVAGTARNARFTVTFTASGSGWHLQSATGGFAASGATLIWLPGVQPLTALAGRFTLRDANDIDIAADTGRLGGIAIRSAGMQITGVTRPAQFATLNVPVGGTLQAALAVLNGPGLGLLKTLPPPVAAATGQLAGIVRVALPLQNASLANIRMNLNLHLAGVTLPLPVQGVALRQGTMNLRASLRQVSVAGSAQLFGAPATVRAWADFGAGGAADLRLTTVGNAALARRSGWAGEIFRQGTLPVDLHVATRGGSGSLTLQADLTPAGLALPVFGWTKPPGAAGGLSLTAGLDGAGFSGTARLRRIDASAPGLDVETAAAGDAVALTRLRIGGTEAEGEITPPSGGRPWRLDLTGNALDLSAAVNPPRQPGSASAAPAGAAPASVQPPSGFAWQARLHFARLRLAAAPAQELDGFDFSGSGQSNFIFRAAADGLATRPVSLTILPDPRTAPGDAETLRLRASDAGSLLRALGEYGDLQNGALDLTARYGVRVPTTGLVTIGHFRLLGAPAFGKILQAVTVLGIPEAVSGPGLEFSRLIVPFGIEGQKMRLKGARAYSASLGFTASGSIDLLAGTYDIRGTVVPAYALNALPGKLPVLGKLFSPEKGGGLFALGYRMTGSTADPKIAINPLSALTPGFLRGIFGTGNKTR